MPTPEEIEAWKRQNIPNYQPTGQAPPPAATPVVPQAESRLSPWAELRRDIKPVTSFLSEVVKPKFNMQYGVIPGMTPSISNVDVPGITPVTNFLSEVVKPQFYMQYGVIPNVEIPGVSPAWRTATDYVTRPLDIVAETTTGMIGAQEALRDKLGIPSYLWNPDVLNISSDIFTRPQTANMTPGELAGTLVEDFRSRPWYQQLGLGVATDPTTPLPFAPIAKAVGRARARAGGVGRPSAEVLRDADRFATPDVMPRGRPWAPSVSPDAAGIPDPVIRPWDVGAAADRPMRALSPGQGQAPVALPPGRPQVGPVDPSIIPDVTRPMVAPQTQRALPPGGATLRREPQYSDARAQQFVTGEGNDPGRFFNAIDERGRVSPEIMELIDEGILVIRKNPDGSAQGDLIAGPNARNADGGVIAPEVGQRRWDKPTSVVFIDVAASRRRLAELASMPSRPMGGDIAQQRAGAISDPRVENYAPRFQGPRVTQGVEQPAVFYRSTGTAGQQRVITYNEARPGAMLLEDTARTVARGGAVETVGVKTGSNILQEGTRAFQRLARKSGTGERGAGESVEDFVKRVANSAKNERYDIVRFIRQPGVHAVVLNEDALIRNYTAPRSEYDLYRQLGVIIDAPRAGQPALMPPPGLRPGTAEIVGRQDIGTIMGQRPGVQRIAAERNPTVPYDAVGRDVGEARAQLRGEVAAASDTGSPVWSVSPDGQVFQATRGPEARPPTVAFEVTPNGDAVIIPWGIQRPRPMSDAAKRTRAQQFDQRLKSSETQGTVAGARSYDEAAYDVTAAETTERLYNTPLQASRPREEGTAFGDNADLPPPRDPADALERWMDAPTHEPRKITVMRQFDGARNFAGLALEDFVLAGRQLLLRAAGRGVLIDRQGMTPLFQALHGEVSKESLSPTLREMFDQIDEVRKLEEADMKAFLEKARGTEFEDYIAFDLDQFQDRMLATPDYFPQLWKKDGVEIATGEIGARPTFTLPRAGTFLEMVEQGYTPMSWDPYKMMAMRKMAGINWRETVTFLGSAKRNGLVKTVGEVRDQGLTGWRPPRGVGSAFEGRLVQSTPSVDPRAGVEGYAMAGVRPVPESIRTPQWALPNEMASFVETMWGRKPAAYIGDKEIIGYIRNFRNSFKSAKLFASFFQHMDISLRTSASLFTLHGLKRGGPLRLPSLAARLLAAQWNTGYRNTIRQRYLSTAPIKGHEDLGISYKMIVEEGLGVQGDITVIQREIADTLTDIERATNPVGKARQKIADANRFFQTGLFDGVYREGISWSLESFIIPAIRRQHPTWTARQVAAEAATVANMMYSSLPQWQSVLKDPWVREFGQTLFFSTNETEGLLRSFFGTMVGPRKSFWLQYYGGMILSLALFANLINVAATGKPLPPEAYSPIDVGNPYSFTGVGYSTQFMSPQLPKWLWVTQGREGSPMHLDIVGQMDTALRVVTDPFGATAARVNVPVRAVVNQARGANFFGEELSVAQRPGQLLTDLYGPIGLTSALGAFTEAVPQLKTVLPEGESRMGVRGQLLEGIAGVGMRAERTGDYLTRISTGVYNEGTNYSDLERFQKLDIRRLPQVETELGLRQETALKREGGEAKYYAALDNIDAERTTKLGNLVMDIRMGLEPYRINRRYYDIETYARGRRRQAGVDKEFEAPDVNDSDPNKRALAQHYAIYDDPRVKRPGDDLDLTMFDTILKQTYLDPSSDQAWTREQSDFVQRNINTRPIPFEIFSQLGAKSQAKQLTSQWLREKFYRDMGRDDLADGSRIRFFMLDAPWMMQPTTQTPQPQAATQPQAAPVQAPQSVQPVPRRQTVEEWKAANLVGAGR